MHKTLTIIFCLFPFLIFSQNPELVNYDHIYQDNIKSVKFHVAGDMISMPIIGVGQTLPLVLSFDDISGEDYINYVYTVQHCDQDWQPSRLTEFEYIDGFTENDIEFYEYSYKTKSVYTHYWFSIPNDDITFTKSGNYLLHVFEEDDMQPITTRRFLVVDTKVNIVARLSRPANVSRTKSHQEIDFTVIHDDFEIRNPRQELTAVVLQNSRWDNALTGLKPLFSRFNEQRFDYQDKIVFPAGKEFRFLDLRGIQYPAPGITVTEKDNRFEATIERDKKRGNVAHFERYDINGNFIIENKDESGRLYLDRNLSFDVALSQDEEREFNQRLNAAGTQLEREQIEQERRILLQNRAAEEQARQFRIFGADTQVDEVHNLQSEYVDVLFTLYSPGEMNDEEIYIYGGLTDWEFKPAFKMVYNPMVNAYVGKATLKQGYYDYIYAALPKGSKEPDFEITEGNWYETENEYTILIYYRPFGSRYDQLIGVNIFSSRY